MTLADDFGDVETIPVGPFGITGVVPRRMQPHVMGVINGKLVRARFQQEMAQLANHIIKYRQPQYFSSGGDVTAIAGNKHWRFAGHFNPTTRVLVARVAMAPGALGAGQTDNPHVQMNVYDTSGNLIATNRAHFGYSFGVTPNETPEEWGMIAVPVDVWNYRDTDFRAEVIANESARPISCTVYGVAPPEDVNNGYMNQQYSVLAPILDRDRGDLVALANALYKRGGHPLFTWSSTTDASAATTPQATVQGRNVIDNIALGNRSGTSPAGFTLDNLYKNRKTKTTVPVKVEVYAGMAAGTGSVFLRDDAGTAYATFSVTGPAVWQTPQFANLPADQRTYYISHNGTGLDNITTYAATVIRHMV